ncbi:hypothetical protein Tco_0032796 [Tanacetum coccineum]
MLIDEDEDEEEEDEEEDEEHLAPADSAIVVPTDEPASISLPPESEVERLMAMTTPSPSPPISLSPPFARERLARIASTQALIDAVTAALPSLPLLPLPPSLYIPPPVDRRDDIPESEQPPRKRLCLSTLGSIYEIGDSSTARPTRDQGVDPSEAVPEIAPMTIGEVNTRVTELAELNEHDTQDLYALLEDTHNSRSRISQQVDMDSQSQAEIAALGETDHRRQAHMVETLRVMRDMRREMGDMQAELLGLREQRRRARQPVLDVRIPDHQDASRDADSHV